MKQDIKSLRLEELQRQLAELGEKPFRARQVFRWLHRGAASFDAMTDLSAALRQRLDERYYITVPQVARKQQSRDCLLYTSCSASSSTSGSGWL